ncbi:MAG: hypothetical protein Q8898_12385 [Bacillota bacterium]|nr:hypothetical protein [Bacillota bacterium]
MGKFDGLLRRPTITLAFCTLNRRIHTKSSVRKSLGINTQSLKKILRITSIQVSDHALERWNERVGPIYSNVQDLEYLLTFLLKMPHRLSWLAPSIGLIDSEIYFVADTIGQTLVIKTFYGRSSLQPSLNQFEAMKRFTYYEDDRLALTIPRHILEEQSPPPVPMELVKFFGRTIEYSLEHYLIKDGSCFFLKTKKEKLPEEIMEIDITDPEQPLLNRSVLFVLHRLGHEKFVLQHLMHHKPDALQKAFKKYEVKRESRLKDQAHSPTM